MANGYEISSRFSHIRPMLGRKITNSEYIIGSYIMTICSWIEEGRSDEEIVNDMAKLGEHIDPAWR